MGRTVFSWLIATLLLWAQTARAASVDELAKRLEGPWKAADADRRAILQSFGAQVPDENGQFKVPPRPPKGGPPPDPEWLTELGKLDAGQPAVAESKAIVETLRALAETRDAKAASILLEFAFKPEGIAFRDECGRLLRKMSPASLPALLRASAQKKRDKGSWSRYASYQLDRLDKARPAYAFKAAATDDDLIAMLDAVREVKHPDAVEAVLDYTDANSHAVRKAARTAWLAYVTGKGPPPAPKAKRKLPGGKLTDEEMPLYLTYRELAIEALKRELTAVEGTEPKRLSAEEMTTRLFAFYDKRRDALWDPLMAEAAQAAQAGDWAKVAEKYDHILLKDPLFGRRAEMVRGYLEVGRAQARAKDYKKATVSLNKALSIDPKGQLAREAEAELYSARAMLAESEGKSGADDLARARKAGGAQTLDMAIREHMKARRGWMLWTGVGTGALALALVGLLILRKRGVE